VKGLSSCTYPSDQDVRSEDGSKESASLGWRNWM
jgi:hypothetical protein